MCRTSFELIGESSDAAKKNAETLMRHGNRDGSRLPCTRVERRNPHDLVHKMKVAELAALAPNFDWAAYFQLMKYPEICDSERGLAGFPQGVNTLLARRTVENWKTYLRFHVADTASPLSFVAIR